MRGILSANLVLSATLWTWLTVAGCAGEPTPARNAPPSYPDHRNLKVYRDEAGRERPIETPADWAVRREHILQGMQTAMGTLPARTESAPPRVHDTSKTAGATVSWMKLRFRVDDDWVPAHLIRPSDRRAGQRLPAMLALHQTIAIGKDEPAGLGGNKNLHYGLELAQRGYIVLCPDYPSFGEYPHDFAKDRNKYPSGTLKGIVNHRRAVDLLAARKDVDPERIGVIGHSLGGHNAMFVGVFDPRLKVVVSSCGWTPFHDYYGGKLDGWTSARYMPRLRDVFQLDPDRVPFDFPELVAALAPRAFFSNSPLHDDNFAVAGVRKAVAAAAPVFRLLGAEQQLQVRTPDCGHEFPPEIRREAYEFIDRVLKHKPPDAFSAELPRVPAREPAEALAAIKTMPGFHLELVAAEPLVASPVAAAFDEQGRMFVVEMRDYPEETAEPLGRVRLLEDTDADGRFDRGTIFVEGLRWPTAVIAFDGGAFVAAAPDILYCKDTDGDGRADLRRVAFTGFGRSNVQGLLNSFQWGLDNRIHGATSSAGGRVRRPNQPEGAAVDLAGRDFSFDPRTLELAAESGGAQHGLSFDDWGRKFVCSNSDHLQMVFRWEKYLARNPLAPIGGARESIAADGPQAEVFRASPVEPWRLLRTRLRVAGLATGPIEGGGRAAGYFTGSSGATIYRGDAWPADCRGQAIVGDVGSNIVHRKRLEPNGAGMIARRIDANAEFIASTDIWFRPVQFAAAPDGTLFVIDMAREVIEHPDSLPPEIKRHLDLSSGRERGRIYRIAPDGFDPTARARTSLAAASTAELVAALAHPDGWHRDTAARLLYERQHQAAVSPLARMANDCKSPLGRLHALYVLAGLGELSPEVVEARLADPHPRVREHAVRLAERLIASSPSLRDCLVLLVDDDDAGVRLQLALTAGELAEDVRTAILTRLARRDVADRRIRSALASSAANVAGRLLTELAADSALSGPHAANRRELLADLAAQVGARSQPQELAAALALFQSLPAGADAVPAVARGLHNGLSRRGASLRDALAGGTEATAYALSELLAAARRAALDSALPIDARLDSIRTLALGRFADERAPLASLLDSRQPHDVQQAALATLARFSDPDVADVLIDAWPAFTPRLRAAATEAVLSRPAWRTVWFAAVEQGRIRLADVEPHRVRLLTTDDDRQTREQAKQLLARLDVIRPETDLAAYQAAVRSGGGDRSAGKQIFAKHCAACHRLDDVGHELGPSLAAARQRGAESILANVLEPNRELNPQYVDYLVVTADGRSHSGLIADETAAAVTLRRAEGAAEIIPRADIETLRSTGLSLMPDGFARQIDPRAMADLIAYLLSPSASPP